MHTIRFIVPHRQRHRRLLGRQRIHAQFAGECDAVLELPLPYDVKIAVVDLHSLLKTSKPSDVGR